MLCPTGRALKLLKSHNSKHFNRWPGSESVLVGVAHHRTRRRRAKTFISCSISPPQLPPFPHNSRASKSVNDFLYSAAFSKAISPLFFRRRQETFILNQAKSRDFRTLYLWTLPEESMRLTYPFHTLQSHPLCLGRYFRHVSIKFFSHTICSLCHWF